VTRSEWAVRSDDVVVGEWPEAAVSEGAGAGEPDRAAFLSFYQEVVPEVYGYFIHRCGDSATAEDLTSETFLAAVRNLEDGRPVPFDVPWVIGVARHKLADHWRRRAREERLLDALEQDPQPEDDPWDVRLDQLHATDVLAALGAHHRLALTLRYVDGLSVAQVAELLGRTPNATEALLVRARSAFRRVYLEGGGHD
jgi:RNA polymerase sigma-70 factor, ECF subfamily